MGYYLLVICIRNYIKGKRRSLQITVLRWYFFENKIQSQKYFKDSMSIWQLQHNFRFRARTFLKWYTVRGDRRVIERLQLFSRIINEMNKKIVHQFVCRNVTKRVKNWWYASVYIIAAWLGTVTYLLFWFLN